MKAVFKGKLIALDRSKINNLKNSTLGISKYQIKYKLNKRDNKVLSRNKWNWKHKIKETKSRFFEKSREDMNLLISETKETITTNVMYNKGMVGQSMHINLMT